MKTTYTKDRPVAGFRISEQEEKSLMEAKEKLGLRSTSETMRFLIKKGIESSLEESK